MFDTSHQMHSGDARDLGFLADESVDLIVTSPPYPMIAMWDEVFRSLSPEAGRALDEGQGWPAFGRMHESLHPAWGEMVRVVRPGGIVAINIGDATRTVGDRFSLYPNHARVLTACTDLGLESLPCIIWRKPTNSPTKFMGSGMLPGGAYVTLEHEYILIFRKNPADSSGADRDRVPGSGGRRKGLGSGGRRKGLRKEPTVDRLTRRRSALFWEERNQWYSDIWDLRGVRQKLSGGAARQRSGAFPLELPFRLIHMYSRQGDLVLDPFGGTGTTALAAVAAGRSSLLVEKDQTLVKRFSAELLASLSVARAREEQRISDHEGFRARFFQERGEDLPYPNEELHTTVRTKQETDLRPCLPVEGFLERDTVIVRHQFPRSEAGEEERSVVD